MTASSLPEQLRGGMDAVSGSDTETTAGGGGGVADSKTVLPWLRYGGPGGGCYVPEPLAELLDRIARGDRAAFAVFYEAVAPRVFGMCWRVLANAAQAEEVTQDVMVELWRTAACYDPAKGSVSSWVLTMAHRRAVDVNRSRHTTAQRERLYVARQAVPAYDQVDETVIDDLDRGRVRDCLAALTGLQRQAATMAYYDGFTYPEVAGILDMHPSAVQARIRAGLCRLRDCHTAPQTTETP